MNPQDYPPQQPSDQSTKAWFDSLNAPAPSPSPNPTPSKKSRKKPFIIFLCAVLILAIGIPASYLYIESASAKMCLSSQHYKELLGINSPDSIDAETNFYTATVEFDSGSSEYSESTEQETEKIIKSIGKLYRSHYKETSIKLSLSADYIYEDAASVASERIQKIKTALINAGVDKSAITSEKPTFIPPESEYESTYDDLPARIGITSQEGCRA